MKQGIGTRIKEYREKVGMSPEDFAKQANIELTLLSAIESNTVYPELGILVKISNALGKRLGTFMDDQFTADPHINRVSELNEAVAAHKGESAGNFHYYHLGRGKTDRHMEPMLIEIDADEDEDIHFSSHEGEEFIVVVSGSVKIIYGKEEFILNEGDSIYYNAVVPHYVGANNETAKIYAVVHVPF